MAASTLTVAMMMITMMAISMNVTGTMKVNNGKSFGSKFLVENPTNELGFLLFSSLSLNFVVPALPDSFFIDSSVCFSSLIQVNLVSQSLKVYPIHCVPHPAVPAPLSLSPFTSEEPLVHLPLSPVNLPSKSRSTRSGWAALY